MLNTKQTETMEHSQYLEICSKHGVKPATVWNSYSVIQLRVNNTFTAQALDELLKKNK